jgi:hypothetical protein
MFEGFFGCVKAAAIVFASGGHTAAIRRLPKFVGPSTSQRMEGDDE